MEKFKQFIKLIRNYAQVYSEFEHFQKANSFIPTNGDQKTGVIGEAFIYQYLSKKGKTNLEFGSTSEKAWDIKDENNIRYQVKTVSAYSQTQRISPIHKGWDYLYLVHLTTDFIPDKILLVKDPKNWNQDVICNIKFPSSTTIKLGTQVCNIENITDDFNKTIGKLQ